MKALVCDNDRCGKHGEVTELDHYFQAPLGWVSVKVALPVQEFGKDESHFCSAECAVTYLIKHHEAAK